MDYLSQNGKELEARLLTAFTHILKQAHQMVPGLQSPTEVALCDQSHLAIRQV